MSRSSLPSSSDIARQVGDSRFTVRPAGWRMAETVSMPPPEDILTIYSLSESYSAERSALWLISKMSPTRTISRRWASLYAICLPPAKCWKSMGFWEKDLALRPCRGKARGRCPRWKHHPFAPHPLRMGCILHLCSMRGTLPRRVHCMSWKWDR